MKVLISAGIVGATGVTWSADVQPGTGQWQREGRLNALVAAEYGVPVILITGDDRACADAAGYAPDAPAVTVKECVSRYAAIGQPPAVSSATEEEHG